VDECKPLPRRQHHGGVAPANVTTLLAATPPRLGHDNAQRATDVVARDAVARLALAGNGLHEPFRRPVLWWRKLKLKAKFEGTSSYSSFKHIARSFKRALNVGVIGSSCTALPFGCSTVSTR